jgi:hypothetical protein
VGVALAICAPRRRAPVAIAPTLPLPPTPHPSNDERHVYAKQYTRSARSCPSKQQPPPLRLLPTSLLGGVVPCQSLPPPSLLLPVFWPDSPVSGAGARNSRFGSLIDLTADRAGPGENLILARTLRQLIDLGNWGVRISWMLSCVLRYYLCRFLSLWSDDHP